MIKRKIRRVVSTDIKVSIKNNDKIYNLYINDVNKYKPLTKEEEVELFKRLENGDKSVIELIAKHNLRFVITVAKSYQDVSVGTAITLEDLIAEGNAGLLDAIEKFDHTKGFKFISFAVFYIKQHIINYISNNMRNIRMTINRYALLRKIKQLESDLEQQYGRNIDEIELLDIAKNENIFRDEYNYLFLIDLKNGDKIEDSLNRPLSLDYNTVEVIDTIENKDNVNIFDTLETKELNSFINKIFKEKLPQNIIKLFEMYYGLNGEIARDTKYIAEYFDITESAINIRIKNYSRLIRKKYKLEFNKLNVNLTNTKIVRQDYFEYDY